MREVEAWLLADRLSFAQYLCVSEMWVPANQDGLRDAKATLIDVAQKHHETGPGIQLSTSHLMESNALSNDFPMVSADTDVPCQGSTPLLFN